MTNCDITVDSSIGVTRVVLAGEIDMSNSCAVGSALHARVADPAVGVVVVDLAGVRFIDASGVRALTTGRNAARRAGKWLYTTGAQGLVAQVLGVLGLTQSLSASGAASGFEAS